MNFKPKTIAVTIIVAALFGTLAALIVNPSAHAADTSLRNYARIVPGMTMEDTVGVFGMEAQVTVLSADVIQLSWFSPDYSECVSVVFIGGKSLTKTRAAVTNNPRLENVPPNVGEPK